MSEGIESSHNNNTSNSVSVTMESVLSNDKAAPEVAQKHTNHVKDPSAEAKNAPGVQREVRVRKMLA